jgi:hypothetical protein
VGRGWLSAEDRAIFAFGESLFLILQQFGAAFFQSRYFYNVHLNVSSL